MSDGELGFKIDGKYRVRIVEDQDTVGLFKGYAAMGGDVALVMEVGGKFRYIPVQQVVYIDEIEAPDAEDPSKKRFDVYYG